MPASPDPSSDTLGLYSQDEALASSADDSDSLSSISPLSPHSLQAVARLARHRPAPPDAYSHPEGRSAVLVCLFGNRTGTNLNVLLTTRSDELRTFPGQGLLRIAKGFACEQLIAVVVPSAVALPGGKMDATDINLEATARREAWEEVGIPIDTTRIRYLTTLPPFLMRNLTLVSPVICLILDYSLKPDLNAAEVSRLFSFPLEGFLLAEPRSPTFRDPPPSTVGPDRVPYHVHEDYTWFKGLAHRFHSFEANPKPVTGVTAEMLIHVAMIAYGRQPEFELHAPNEMSHPELIEHAMRDPRWQALVSRSCMRLLRALAAASVLLPSVLADDRVFYARAVSYCSESRAIEIDKFLLEYDDTTKFISFDISAASVEANLDAILNLELVAYGINAVNTTLNLCDLLSGLLCPLPQYHFVGSATIPLPSSVTGNINIPTIGFYIPDLEATAYVRLLRVQDGSEAACLRVDLSNGKTVRWASVSWALGGLAIGTVLLSILFFFVGTLVYPPATAALTSIAHGSLSPALWAQLARRKERLFLLANLLQFTATTGILSLEYPIIYDSYTANFAWALGLVREGPIQEGIDSLRNGTGGNLTRLAGSRRLVGGTESSNALLSSSAAKRSVIVPDEVPSMAQVVPALLDKIGESFARSTSVVTRVVRRAANPVNAVAVPNVQQQDTLNAVHYGIPHALVNLNISPYNALMTVFINFLFLMAIVVALALLGGVFWILLTTIARRKARRRERELGVEYTHKEKRGWKGIGWKGLRRSGSGPFTSLVRSGSLRLLLIVWYPLLLFTFYQWTIGTTDSYAPIVLSVFTIFFVGLSLLLLSLRFIMIARRAWRGDSVSPPGSYDTVESNADRFQASSPFRPPPTTEFVTPNPSKKALPKAQAREAESLAVGRLLVNGGASYAPFWNAYKMRSRRTTGGRRNGWKGRGWWFGVIELVLVPLVTALFVAFAHNSGWTQSVALVTIQALLFLVLCIWTPYEDKSSNATHIFLAVWRIVVAGALISFNESIELNEIARVAVGAVLAVILSVLVILYFILLMIDLVSLVVFLVRGIKLRRRATRVGETAAADGPNGAVPQMSAMTREKPAAERELDRHSSDESSAPVSNNALGRSSMTLGNDYGVAGGPAKAPPPVTSG
ncbi:hypothetical protein JCM10212_000317 [Sporobolomyces blumeae]